MVGWGIKLLQLHVDNPRLKQTQYLSRPGVVTIRNPYMCFLTWWKNATDVIRENIEANQFFQHWAKLDHILEVRKRLEAPTVMFYVDIESLESLADRLGVAYQKIGVRQSAHYISDDYVTLNYDNVPDALHELAAKWGYEPV